MSVASTPLLTQEPVPSTPAHEVQASPPRLTLRLASPLFNEPRTSSPSRGNFLKTSDSGYNLPESLGDPSITLFQTPDHPSPYTSYTERGCSTLCSTPHDSAEVRHPDHPTSLPITAEPSPPLHLESASASTLPAMADASCSGPSPFKRLVDHQGRDVSHHQDRLRDGSSAGGHGVSCASPMWLPSARECLSWPRGQLTRIAGFPVPALAPSADPKRLWRLYGRQRCLLWRTPPCRRQARSARRRTRTA